MKLKLLTLAGLCAMLVALWNQPVRAGCTWGRFDYEVCGNYCMNWTDSGCVYEGYIESYSVCYYYVGGHCAAGTAYYSCGCT
jgi:hypothetical protein